jgi:hypothetical protein
MAGSAPRQTPSAPTLISTLYVAQALGLIGRVQDLDGPALRAHALSCWISPGFATVGSLNDGRARGDAPRNLFRHGGSGDPQERDVL